MEKKNRFSNLLEHLMSMSDLKNSALAQTLQYDTSYISKWTSGRSLPSEKNIEKILRGISSSVVDAMDPENKNRLYTDYQVDVDDDLKSAVYDHLQIEYNYVKGLKNTTGSETAPETSYYAKLTLPQFAEMMHHPALREISSMKAVAAMDLLSLEHEYRSMIAQVDSEHVDLERDFPSVHYSMLLNLKLGKRDYIYDTIFLINLLTNSTHINMKIYNGPQAYGKLIFCMKDAFSISSMLFDSNYCSSVTLTEDVTQVNSLYHTLKSLCGREMLLFRNITMREMLKNFDYLQYLLSTDKQWLMGHMAEYFLPDILFDEIAAETRLAEKWGIDEAELCRTHALSRSILEDSPVQIIIYESAFNDFVVSGVLDFYNNQVTLSTDQRLRYIRHIRCLMEQNPRLEIKLVHGDFIRDFQDSVCPNLYMSNNICYLRLENKKYRNNLVMLNGMEIKEMFQKFYQEIWSSRDDVVVEDKTAILDTIHHALMSIEILSKSE
ncbi:MAG: hypothetical protein ACI4EG_09440 [Fusicatenibacter sp.]|nr:hypothetical protein [Fusicatenibacter sp.]